MVLLDTLRYASLESVFWARELILSQEDELLYKTVIKAWLMYLGPDRIDWLDAWTTACAACTCTASACTCKTINCIPITDKLNLIAEFCEIRSNMKKRRMPKSALTFWIAGRGLSPNDDCDEERDAAFVRNDPINAYWYLGKEYEKKPTAVLQFVTEMVDTPEIFDSIKKAMALKMPIQIRVLLSVAAIQVLCLKEYPDTLTVSQKSADTVATLLNEYDTVKKGRVLSIKEKQLSYCKKRLTQLEALCMGPMELMESGCAFWKQVLTLIKDDETKDAVINEYFPDDIPDEWSIKERAKSHPEKFTPFVIHVKPEYRMKLVWSCNVVLRKEWHDSLNGLFKACGMPSC